MLPRIIEMIRAPTLEKSLALFSGPFILEGQIIVDAKTWHATPELEGMALTEQKGFLPLGRKAFHKHRSRKTEPSGQEGDFDQPTCKLDSRLAKVELCPLAR